MIVLSVVCPSLLRHRFTDNDGSRNGLQVTQFLVFPKVQYVEGIWTLSKSTNRSTYIRGQACRVGRDIPPRIFFDFYSPLQEGLSWAKYSPPRKNFWANYLKISPPRKNILENFRKILEFWCRVVKDIPPFEVKKSIPLQKFFQKILPPMKIFKISPTPRSWVLAHVWFDPSIIESISLFYCWRRVSFNQIQLRTTYLSLE